MIVCIDACKLVYRESGKERAQKLLRKAQRKGGKNGEAQETEIIYDSFSNINVQVNRTRGPGASSGTRNALKIAH